MVTAVITALVLLGVGIFCTGAAMLIEVLDGMYRRWRAERW